MLRPVAHFRSWLRPPKNNMDGFTIVELVVAISAFAILVPALSTGLNTLTVINNRSRDLALVNMLAHNKAELLRSAGYNSISEGAVDFTSELPNTVASPKSASYTVTSPAEGLKEILITISYHDTNSTRTISYKTIISEIGVGQ